MPLRAASLKDVIFAELVRSLFATVAPSLIMSAAFIVAVILVPHATGDRLRPLVEGFGVLASIWRLGIVFYHRSEALGAKLDGARARILERRFALSYFAFAASLGAFGAGALASSAPEAHMLTICLLVGYCAGTATGTGLRPKIAVPAMSLAIVPAIVMMLFKQEPIYVATGAIAAALLAGGIHSVLARHRTVMIEIGQRVTFGSIARSDGLTQLGNRLALREWFDEQFTLAAGAKTVAVHYLDLNGFKPVNDRYGHLVGDALLCAVGARLAAVLRPGDMVARLGGDEFAIVQQLGRAEESQLLVHRIRASLRLPFHVEGHEISISACVGTAITDDKGCDLEQLLFQADQALYEEKRRGRRSRDPAAA